MKIEEWPLTQIKPYKNNPRKNDAAVDIVAASLRRFGKRQPIVVDQNGVIIMGHTRLKAAQKNGYKSFPVHVAKELSEKKAAALRLADNKTGEIAEWDDALLDAEIENLDKIDTFFFLDISDIDLSEFSVHDEEKEEKKSLDYLEQKDHVNSQGETSSVNDKKPLSIVLGAEDFKKWEKYRDGRSDTAAFLKLLNEVK